MSKPISRPTHGVLDYSYAAAIAASPELFGFAEARAPKMLMRILGGSVLLTSLCTRYELGLIKVLPFKLHLAGDAFSGLFALGAPFLLGFSDNKRARNTFIGFGLLALVVGALTQPDEME